MRKQPRIVMLDQATADLIGRLEAQGFHLCTAEVMLGQDGKPPTEFRVFAVGMNESYKGTFKFDDKSCSEVMEDCKAHGAILPIDYNHASEIAMYAPDPAKAGEAAGWWKPEVRAGELWATQVEWTTDAYARLTEKKYRYHSAVFRTDEEGRINRVRSIALTNIPAMHGQEALLSQTQQPPPKESSMDWKMLAAALGLPATATEEDVKRALRQNGEVFTALSQLTGKTTPAELIGHIQGLAQEAGKVTALSQEITAMKSAQENARREALIADGVKAGKLTPATAALAKTWALSQLEEFLKVATPAVPTGEHRAPGQGQPVVPGAEVKLSQEEQEVAEMVGNDPAKVLARKQKLGHVVSGQIGDGQ